MCVLTYAHRLRALTPHRRRRKPADLPATT
ncbi:hypothetical protein SAFG77S_03298 [Streptomyces afghaniensis]